MVPGWVEQLSETKLNEDKTAVKRTAHTIKNSADTVGATGVYDLAWQLEQAAGAGTNTVELANLAASLRASLKILTGNLLSWTAETQSSETS